MFKVVPRGFFLPVAEGFLKELFSSGLSATSLVILLDSMVVGPLLPLICLLH
jgi:hypothetical protein